RPAAPLEPVPLHGRAAAGKQPGRLLLPAELAFLAAAARALRGDCLHSAAPVAGGRRRLPARPPGAAAIACRRCLLGPALRPRRLPDGAGRAPEPASGAGLAALGAAGRGPACRVARPGTVPAPPRPP